MINLAKLKICNTRLGKFKLIILIYNLIFLNLTLNSQENVTLYLNNNWEITKKDKATYFRDADYNLNSFKLDGLVKEYTLDSTQLMEGHYKSHKRNGNFRFYYKNGDIKCEGEYIDNLKAGLWTYYHPGGKIKQKIIFNSQPYKFKFSVVESYDERGNQLIANGTGKWVVDSIIGGSLDNTSMSRLTGQFKDSLMTGTWKLTRITDNKIIHREVFRKGKFISASVYMPHCDCFGTTTSEILNKFYDDISWRLDKIEEFTLDPTEFPSSLVYEDIETIFKTVTGKDYKIKQRQAMYPKGNNRLLEFIGLNLTYPINAVENRISGRVFVNVVIDAEGKPKETYILRGVSKELDSEAIRVVKLIEEWLPAIEDGQNVESTISIPVEFRLK